MPQNDNNVQNRPTARDLIEQFLADTDQPEKIDQIKKLDSLQFETYVKRTIRLLMRNENIIAEASATPIYFDDSTFVIHQDEKDKRESLKELLKANVFSEGANFKTIEITDSMDAHLFEGQLAKRGVEIRKDSRLITVDGKSFEAYYYQLLNPEYKMLLGEESIVTLYRAMTQINTLLLRSIVLNNKLLSKHDDVTQRFTHFSKESSIIYLIALLNHPQWARTKANRYEVVQPLTADLAKHEAHLEEIIKAVQGWKALLEAMYTEFYNSTSMSYELGLLKDLLLHKANTFLEKFPSQIDQNNAHVEQCKQVVASLTQLAGNSSEDLTQAATNYLQTILDIEEYFKQNVRQIPAMKAEFKESNNKLSDALKGIQYINPKFSKPTIATSYIEIYSTLQIKLAEVKRSFLSLQQHNTEKAERAKLLMSELGKNKNLLKTLLKDEQMAPIERLHEFYVKNLQQDHKYFSRISENSFRELFKEIRYHEKELAKCLSAPKNSAAQDANSVRTLISIKSEAAISEQKQEAPVNVQSNVATGMQK